jgi:trans-2,3-dihydro-3-hydroxyanthranilate isomerase
LDGRSTEIIIVDACLRDGAGGSPTAVINDCDGLDDIGLARIPAQTAASHVAVVLPHDSTSRSRKVRFFTAEGELPGCGHGTVAVIAVLASQGAGAGFQGRLCVAGRDFEVTGRIQPGHGEGTVVEAWFDQGVVEHRKATGEERTAFLAALELEPNALHPDDEVAVASPGRPRLMVPVIDRMVLAGIHPDQHSLAAASLRHGQLGCFVYVPPSVTHPAAARMFAPAIGVPEDVANANSSGCLAAHLLITGRTPTVAVDQGDALGRPSRVYATAIRSPGGVTTRVGGTARVLRPIRVPVEQG